MPNPLKYLRKVPQDARFIKQSIFDLFRRVEPRPFQPDLSTMPSRRVAIWLGHASFLIRWNGIWILTDPVLSSRLGPFGCGPKRHIATALLLRELPSIEGLLISHAHADHLDIPTLSRLEGVQWAITSSGVGSLVRKYLDCDWIHELSPADDLSPPSSVFLKVRGLEVKHQNGRWRGDEHRQCVGFYVSEADVPGLVFVGDTAWTPNLSQNRLGGHPALALLPIGGYDPFQRHHCTPEEAIEMAGLLGTKAVFAHQHSTFMLSHEPLDEPLRRFLSALADRDDLILAGTGLGEVIPF